MDFMVEMRGMLMEWNNNLIFATLEGTNESEQRSNFTSVSL
jgi:hypothetical protein